MGKLTSLEDAAASVQSGMTLAFGGMTNYRRPAGFAAELVRQGTSANLTLLGLTLGIESDILVAAGMVAKTRTCYFGLEYLPAPAFTDAAQRGTLDIIEETEASLALGLRAALMGVPYLPSNAWSHTDLPSLRPDVARQADGLYAFPSLRPDVAVIHVEKADAQGNAVVSGNRGIDREIASLAEYTIITAERIVPTEEIAREGAYLSAEVVDAVVELPLGAYPTSCYPEYTFDFSFLRKYLEHSFTGNLGIFVEDYVRTADHEEYLSLSKAKQLLQLDPRKLASLAPGGKRKASTADVMAKAIADCISDEMVAQGIATPLVAAGYALAKASGKNVRFASAVGNCLTERISPLSLQGYEFLLLDSAVSKMSFAEAACEVLPLLAPKEFLRPAQVDRSGRTNNLWTVNAKSGERMRWPGAGGIPDVTAYNEKLHLYLPRQRDYNLVERVEMVSGAGCDVHGPVKLVTDLAVFSFESGEAQVQSIHPGVSEKQLQKETGFALDIPANVPRTPEPDSDELALLQVVDPLGIRDVELLSGLKRLMKTLDIASKERDAMR